MTTEDIYTERMSLDDINHVIKVFQSLDREDVLYYDGERVCSIIVLPHDTVLVLDNNTGQRSYISLDMSKFYYIKKPKEPEKIHLFETKRDKNLNSYERTIKLLRSYCSDGIVAIVGNELRYKPNNKDIVNLYKKIVDYIYEDPCISPPVRNIVEEKLQVWVIESSGDLAYVRFPKVYIDRIKHYYE